MIIAPLVSLSLLVPLVLPQGGPQKSPAALFPDDSFAVAGFAGLDACRAAAPAISWREIADEAAAKFAGGSLVELGSRGMPQVDRQLARLGIDRATVRAVLSGELAVGVGRPTMRGDQAMPSIAVVVSAGGVRDAGDRLVAALQRLVHGSRGGADEREVAIDGVTARIVTPHSRHQPALLSAWLGDHLVLTNSLGYLRGIVRTWQGQQPALLDAADAQQARGAFEADDLLWGYVRTAPFSALFQRVVPYEIADVMAAVGVRGLEGLFLGHGATADSGVDEVRFVLPQADGGLLAAALGGGIEARAARYLPPNTLVFATHRIDGEKLVPAVENVVAAMPVEAREELGREVEREVAPELRGVGLDLETCLQMVAALGPEVTVGIEMPEVRMGVPALPAAMMFLEARPGAQLAQRLETALVAQGAEPRVQELDGRRLVYVPVQLDELRLSPSFVEEDGMLIVATELRALKRALNRANESEGRLSDDAGFQSTIARHADAAALWHLRLSHNIGAVYAALRPMLDGWLDSNAELGVTSDDLPTAEELQAALGDISLTLDRDDRGIALRLESQFAGGALVAVAGALLDEVLAAAPKRRVE